MIKSDPIICPIRVEEFSYTELTIYDKEGTPKTSVNNIITSMANDSHWTEYNMQLGYRDQDGNNLQRVSLFGKNYGASSVRFFFQLLAIFVLENAKIIFLNPPVKIKIDLNAPKSIYIKRNYKSIK